MSNVLFRMVNGEQKAHFQSNEATPEIQMAIVKGMFATFGAAALPIKELTLRQDALIPEAPFALEEAVAILQPLVMNETKAADLQEKQKAEVKAAKKEAAATVAVEEPARFSTSIAERFQARPAWKDGTMEFVKVDQISDPEDDEELERGFHYINEETLPQKASSDDIPLHIPLHFRTGYKLENGERRYKTRYWCGRCNTKSNAYIEEGQDTVDCHNCGNSMKVHSAVPFSIIPEPDAFLNWYIAGLQKPIKVISQNKYDRLIKSRSR